MQAKQDSGVPLLSVDRGGLGGMEWLSESSRELWQELQVMVVDVNPSYLRSWLARSAKTVRTFRRVPRRVPLRREWARLNQSTLPVSSRIQGF
jgi:hypothetical protein